MNEDLITEAVKKLDQLNGDPEIDHGYAEDIVLELIENLTNTDEITKAFDRAKNRVGFWYA